MSIALPPDPTDPDLYNKTARNGDVGGVLLNMSIAIRHLATALERVAASSDVDVSIEIGNARNIADASFHQFKRLTGWKDGD